MLRFFHILWGLFFFSFLVSGPGHRLGGFPSRWDPIQSPHPARWPSSADKAEDEDEDEETL